MMKQWYKDRSFGVPAFVFWAVISRMAFPVFSQITPPPQIHDGPVIANNRIYYLKTIPKNCDPPIIDKFLGGAVITDKRALMKKDNPHIIKGLIQIEPSGCLYIEPGTVLKFAPGQGIIVNGTLIARGSELPGGRITMTKLEGEDLKRPSGDWQDDARLVMGNTTRDGRLDLKYQGRWRAVCTNYNNFTEIDANVTCRHLGFLKGNFTYHSFARNLTDYILWEKPDCRGAENNLFDCPGANTIRIGRHICDGQEVVGFHCEGLRPGLALDHWRGIDFFNSATETRYQIPNNYRVYMNQSLSFLEYLDISYTGLDMYHGRTSELDIFYQKAAISASFYVPMMNNVTIRYGAYDALNLTEVTGPIHIANSTISYNRGYGMFIQSTIGRCLINTTEVNHNWGDGIKFYLSNLTIFDFRRRFLPAKSFCVQAVTADTTYPFYQHMDLVQVNGNDRSMVSIGGRCDKSFATNANMKITVHFLVMERDPLATGSLTFREGSELGRVIQQVPISNGTFPQSITTRTNSLFIEFRYKQPQNLVCKTFPPCIRFLLEFTSGFDVDEEFRLLMSSVHDNVGYGVNIQDMRSKVRISNETVISNNQFGAGVLVYKGAGDIVINGTRIEKNADAGVNITYSGGYQLINSTQVIANKGYGIITEYLKLNHTRLESQNKMEVVRAKFQWNELIGLRIGNYCKGGDILVNESNFAYSFDEAIEYLSCNASSVNATQVFKTKFRVEFNIFNSNFRHAILMRPLLQTEGIITNNTFVNHSLGTLRIDNGYDLLISRWYREFPVIFNIFENVFENNMGRYVISISLTQGSSVQNLYCKFNYFQHNEINDSFPFLNPRSRANAVVVLSSSNVKFQRNFIDNPGSVREVATHLVDPSVKIDATENYWGTEINRQADYEKVNKAIFDQDDRYNLAQVQYHPALKTLRLYENYLSDDVPEYIWQFQRGNVVGGLLETKFVMERGKTYYVDRDIYIFPDKTLQMNPGSQLKFMPSIGMIVHGILGGDGGGRETPLKFDLDDREEFIPVKNRTASIRLVDGEDEFEGRLEVEIDGTWGTVCNDGWTEANALLACLQLGLVFNRDYPTPQRKTVASSGTPILMSWVSCDDVDIDLTKCRSVNLDAVTCGHDKDVFIRCQKPTWAGITLAASYKLDQTQPGQSESQLRFVEINNAGLLDPDTGTMTPALRIDYNSYQISWITIQNCMSDGIQVSYNKPYALNKMEYITVLNSYGNGLVTKSPILQVMHSRFDNNRKAGFLYDPFFTEYDALLIRNTIYPLRRINMFAQSQITLLPDQLMFLVCLTGQTKENKDYMVEITAASSVYKLTLQILDYLPVEAVEKVIIYDSNKESINSPGTRRWEIEKDLVDFPILSSFAVLTIHLKLNGQLSGRLAFAVFPRAYGTIAPQLLTSVTNTTFNGNHLGIVTKHYNSPSNKRLELFHRHREEQILFKDVKVNNSVSHAMHMPSVTKFTEDYIPTYEDMTKPERVAKIIYTIHHCEFNGNAAGILAEHNHVDFANNVWQWTLDQVTMQSTKSGGLSVELPRVNDESEREVHAVTVVESTFWNNVDFTFAIAGYYAQLKIDKNEFNNNKCLLGLIYIAGMEKNMSLNSNVIKDNNCRYMVDIDILSHSEYFTTITGQMHLNQITGNFYSGQMPTGGVYLPRSYAVAVKGLQNMKANYNILVNPTLEYELVAGVTSILLGTTMNVTLNYWGFTDQATIRERIFDFDDWNNYAIAEYFPYLTVQDPNSIPSTGIREEIFLNPNHLGGRVERSQVLAEIGRPYIVQSDLTIMPGVTLTIPPGSELQFMPNVGILVLGRLVASGLPYSRIKFQPIQPSNNLRYDGKRKRHLIATERFKRNASPVNVRLRGDGTLFKDAGFLELYNTSTKSWNIMCDSQFNEKTAEVVCRELGKEVINVKVRFTHLYDYYIYGKAMYFRKEFWYNSYYCRGDETSLNQCITRYNYNLLPCVFAANYTFITCGKRNLDSKLDYWGNIRFAMDAYEEKPLAADIGTDRSILSYVDIVGGGILHGEKVGAIQSTYVTPIFRNINISLCADNGYDVIAPRQNLNIQYQNISGNLGFGINVLVLNGETSLRDSSFLPSGPSTIPYSVHGLVDICRLEKEIEVQTRLILFYKYGPYTRDCVKIIRSRRTVGLRFLQVNLFHEDFSRNNVEIFDGTATSSSKRLGYIVANSSNQEIQRLFQTTGDVMSIHVHASVSFGSYGFIAEVVRLPLAGLVYPNSEYSHTIQQAEIQQNEDGAIQYKNVGETTPSLYIEHCWLGRNGYPVLNLTSPPSIDISLQSTISFRFSHNQVSHNYGGMYLSALTSTLSTALKGNITNNVFAFGTHGEALNISGHYFQRLMLFQNYFYNYTTGDYRDVIHVKNVVVNLTHNYILRNIGHYIIHTHSSDDGTDSQLFSRNGIYDNNATALRESTIKISHGRPRFVKNFLINKLNDFEMMTYPKTESYSQAIDAKDNWWGSEREAYIGGKIHDRMDDSLLVGVDYWPPIVDNRSLVEGDCLPGWVRDRKRCYRYMGGALPFEEAKQFCQSHKAFLAEARDREAFFNYLLRLMVIEQDWTQRIWVMSEVGPGRCAAFERNYLVYEEECNRRYYPFICETNPELTVPEELTSAVKAMIIGISVGVGCLIVIIAVVIAVLWCMKSKQRRKERFERTASMRSSLNNLTKIDSSLRGTRSTLTGLSIGASRQRLTDLDNRSLDYSVDKNSQRSAVSSEGNKSERSIHYSDEVSQNSQTLIESKKAKPIHSLRPDRSKAGKKNQSLVKHAGALNRDREKEKRENKYRYKRDDETDEDENYSDNSDEHSDKKKSIDSDSTSGENSMSDEEFNSKNNRAANSKASPLRKSNEQLLQKPLASGKSRYDPLIKPKASIQDDSPSSRFKNKSLSIFTDNVQSPASSISLPRSNSKEGLLARSSDQKRPQEVSTPVKPSPKPAVRPKPLPPMRKPANEGQGQSEQSIALLAHTPQEKSTDDRDHLYTNKQGIQPQKILPSAKQEDRALISYSVKNPSQNANMYAPIDYNTTFKSQYAFDQKPDNDYMPRPLGNPALGLSRERLDDSSSASSKSSIFKSDIDSVISQQNSASSSKSYKPLPPKPGASVSSSTRFLPSVSSLDSKYSKDSSSTQLPPYSPPPVLQPSKSQSQERLYQRRRSRDRLDDPPVLQSVKSQSREKLNQTRRSRERLDDPPVLQSAKSQSREKLNQTSRSRERLHDPPVLQSAKSQSREKLNQTRRSREQLNEQPPPLVPSKDRLQPRNLSGSRDVLYLAQGAKANSESVETEI